MKRTAFLQTMSLTVAVSFTAPSVFGDFLVKDGRKKPRRLIATEVQFPQPNKSAQKRIKLTWKTFTLPPASDDSNKVILRFPKLQSEEPMGWLRLTAASGLSEFFSIDVFLATSLTKIGSFDMKRGFPFQTFQLPVEKQYISAISEEGIILKGVNNKNPAKFFMPDSDNKDNEGLQPHLLFVGEFDAEVAMFNHLFSMNSLAPFNWIGGCVWDSLYEFSKRGNKKALSALKKQLNIYLDDEKGVISENGRGEIMEGTFLYVQDLLPFVPVISLYPDHIGISKVLDFIKTKERPDGIISDGGLIDTEGCYTVAYPLAAIAVYRNDRTMARKAVQQILFRTGILVDGAVIYQAGSIADKSRRDFRLWGRGMAWYLLGTVKTLVTLEKSLFRDIEELKQVKADFIQGVAVLSKWQTADGFWYCYLDRPETGIETSGTAGIAAAIAWGVSINVLDKSMLIHAQKAYTALLAHVTPDGFVNGASQINVGGEALQANNYRVLTQYALGMMAQLKAGLY